MKSIPSSMTCSRCSRSSWFSHGTQSDASSVVTATACSCGVVFLSILLGTCCSVAIDCSALPSRGSLFVVILRLLSDPDGFECPALFSSSPPTLRHHQCRCCCCSIGSHPVRVLVPSLSSRHSCRYPVQSLWRCRVVCLMRMILQWRLKGVVSIPALCPVRSSFGILTRDDKWHWPLFSMRLTP